MELEACDSRTGGKSKQHGLAVTSAPIGQTAYDSFHVSVFVVAVEKQAVAAKSWIKKTKKKHKSSPKPVKDRYAKIEAEIGNMVRAFGECTSMHLVAVASANQTRRAEACVDARLERAGPATVSWPKHLCQRAVSEQRCARTSSHEQRRRPRSDEEGADDAGAALQKSQGGG